MCVRAAHCSTTSLQQQALGLCRLEARGAHVGAARGAQRLLEGVQRDESVAAIKRIRHLARLAR